MRHRSHCRHSFGVHLNRQAKIMCHYQVNLFLIIDKCQVLPGLLAIIFKPMTQVLYNQNETQDILVASSYVHLLRHH